MGVKSKLQDGVGELVIDGNFNFDCHLAFRDAYRDLLAQQSLKTIKVQLFDVTYIDSSALGMLLVLKDEASKIGIRDIQLDGARGAVKDVLKVAKFDKFFAML